MTDVRMFVNGQAMRGGTLHHALRDSTFLGEVLTTPRYRFYAFPDEFPGLRPVADGGARIAGELFAVTYDHLRERLLPGEPPELELSAIELADGSGSLSMIVREGTWQAEDVVDITESGGWRAYYRGETGSPA